MVRFDGPVDPSPPGWPEQIGTLDRDLKRIDEQAAAELVSLRIVSLSPAISRMLVDLGLADHVVGRTPWCEALPESIVVVGDLLSVDHERLVKLKPTHVLVQAAMAASAGDNAGTANPVQALESEGASHGWRVGSWTSVNRIADIRSLVLDLPATLCEPNSNAHRVLLARAEALAKHLDESLALPSRPSDSPDETSGAQRPAWQGTVLLVHGAQPVLVFGRETYLDDVLLALGVRNAATCSGWCSYSLEDVTKLNPEAIIWVSIMDEGPDAIASVPEAIRSLDVDAVRTGRIAVLSDRDALLPSTSVIVAATRIREILQAFAEREP